MIEITGTVGTSGKYIVSGSPIETTTNTILKITFENNTSGTNLELVAGTLDEFNTGAGGMKLIGSGGPGFQFLAIVDAQKLLGKYLYVRRKVGTASSKFTIIIE